MNDKQNVMNHLNNAKRLWDDESIKTPGSSFESFVMEEYGPSVAKKSIESVIAPLNRYKSYFTAGRK